MATKAQIDELLSRGVDEVIIAKDLRQKLLSGKPLRVKHGVDPTGKDLHIGYAVVYWKLRELQEMGHKIIFLIGSFTARFGDPTDKTEMRKMRTKEDVEREAENYINQVGKILDLKKTEIRYNSEWYDKMSAEGLLRIMSEFTVARMLERDMFQDRMAKEKDISLHEIVYPVLQGYDSVELESDLTVIGTDQKFNELQARPLQKSRGQVPQDIITVPMLVGTDGKEKMGQSLDNYIGITEAPNEKFGKVMSIPDEAIPNYYELAARASQKKVEEVEKRLKTEENPRDIKLDLASDIVKLYHGEKAAKGAKVEFLKVFTDKEKPSEIPEKRIKPGPMKLVDLLVEIDLAASKSEARRLVEQGGVRIDDKVIKNWQQEIEVTPGIILQVGRRKFTKIS
ncbi:tyrosine--tRNA ligase [Patescibacteria group bacterium]